MNARFYSIQWMAILLLPAVGFSADDAALKINLSSGIKGVIYVDRNGNDILDQEDTLLRNAEVSVVDIEDEDAPIVKSGYSDERGKFKILGLHTGEYRLRIVSKVAEPFVTDSFELEGGEEGLEFNINVLERNRSLYRFKDRSVSPQNVDADEVSVAAPQ